MMVLPLSSAVETVLTSMGAGTPSFNARECDAELQLIDQHGLVLELSNLSECGHCCNPLCQAFIFPDLQSWLTSSTVGESLSKRCQKGVVAPGSCVFLLCIAAG
jgi:hypothetical protein